MSSSDDDIVQRTMTAKREAEKLKDKIKHKKESLADTTRKFMKRNRNGKKIYKKLPNIMHDIGC